MSISKINFTADNALLNKYNSSTQTNPTTQVDSTNATSADEKVQAESAQPETQAQENSTSNKKKWVVGLSAATVLTALGVLAGRKGYLGEGAQKLLGGVKKETGNLNQKADNLLNDIELPTGNNASSTPNITIINSEEATSTGTKSGLKWHIEEPEKEAANIAGTGKKEVAEDTTNTVLGKSSETTSTTPKTETSTPKAESQVVTAENLDVDKINASLNRTLPKLDYPTQVEVPDTKVLLEESKHVLDSIKTSGLKPNGTYSQKLPNGNSCHFTLDKNGTIESYAVFDKQHKLLHHFSQSATGSTILISQDDYIMRILSDDKSLLGFSKVVDSNIHVNYNKYGLLDNITEFADGVKISRKFEPQQNNGLIVSYYDTLNPQKYGAIKMEAFQDGKLETELFFDGSTSMQPIKEIYHEIK